MTAFRLRPDKDLTVLIPARAGSKRIPGKNLKELGGKPLIQWTIDAAKAAHVASIIVSTDDMEVTGGLAFASDCRLHERKPEHATDEAPDILWVLDVLPMVETPYVAICRPTSPFRTASTIRRGFAQFVGSGAHSVRAVERVWAPHPGKMWFFPPNSKYMQPVMEGDNPELPLHSRPTQTLPPAYKQNASLEIACVSAIRRTRTISGYRIAPFLTETLEGFDINEPEDWDEAERLALKMAAPIS